MPKCLRHGDGFIVALDACVFTQECHTSITDNNWIFACGQVVSFILKCALCNETTFMTFALSLIFHSKFKRNSKLYKTILCMPSALFLKIRLKRLTQNWKQNNL